MKLLSSLKLVSPNQWKMPHWIMIIVMAFVGATLNYVEAVPSAQLLQDLATSAGLLALLKGALAAGIISALGVAMEQIRQTNPPPGGSFKKNEEDTKPEIKSVPPTAVLQMLLFAAMMLAACSACSGVPAPSPNVIAPTIATTVCIINSVSQCVAQKVPWGTCVISTAAACGSDATTIATVWDAHVKAEVTEGFVPKAFASDGGAP
jgi:hypothetical protein